MNSNGKPEYRIPSMKEIAKVKKHGLTVVSTFSGCGGSCLGFEMEGYTVLWASEFVKAAQETYRANHPKVILDMRDIRTVKPEEILKAIGKRKGDVDVFEGSPPCQSFSTAGKRQKSWGKINNYSDHRQRSDDLFFEYARLVKGIQPRVFVAENVSGLVKGVAKGYFLEILAALKACGYRVRAKVLDAQWLGVPQMRARVIFVGVRNDLKLEPVFPKPLAYRYSVRDALPWISDISTNSSYQERWKSAASAASAAILASGGNEKGGMVITTRGGDWKGTEKLNLEKPSPTLTGQRVFHVEAESDISRYAIGDEWDKLKQGEQSGKYFNLVKADPEKPSPAVLAKGSVISAASVTHPTEKRKFTIAELRRICGFPDDFILTGSYAEQWARLGNAVPPPMMAAVAREIRNEILRWD